MHLEKQQVPSNASIKLAWLTDIHINFLNAEARQKFYADILATSCDALLISGDIAEAPSLTDLLNEMAAQIKSQFTLSLVTMIIIVELSAMFARN